MSTFKVGDKVKCIDNMGTDLAKGSEYLVSDIRPGDTIRVEGRSSSWVAERFELAGEETTLPPTFGELPMVDRVVLFVAQQEGKTIQQWTVKTWYDCIDYCPIWSPKGIYRIKPDEAIPDSFNWSHATFNYVARDENGDAYGFTEIPTKNRSHWVTVDDEYCSLEFFTSYKKGNLPWDQSLICRPGFEVKNG